jgi:hypothetical protein
MLCVDLIINIVVGLVSVRNCTEVRILGDPPNCMILNGSTAHNRRSRRYEAGETVARYGIARQLDNGEYEFMTEYGNWLSDYAYVWRSPPHHYLAGKTHPPVKAFIVNFNKPKSPKPNISYL